MDEECLAPIGKLDGKPQLLGSLSNFLTDSPARRTMEFYALFPGLPCLENVILQPLNFLSLFCSQAQFMILLFIFGRFTNEYGAKRNYNITA